MSDILVAYQTLRTWLESGEHEMPDEVGEAMADVLQFAADSHAALSAEYEAALNRIADLEAALAGE